MGSKDQVSHVYTTRRVPRVIDPDVADDEVGADAG